MSQQCMLTHGALGQPRLTHEGTYFYAQKQALKNAPDRLRSPALWTRRRGKARQLESARAISVESGLRLSLASSGDFGLTGSLSAKPSSGKDIPIGFYNMSISCAVLVGF